MSALRVPVHGENPRNRISHRPPLHPGGKIPPDNHGAEDKRSLNESARFLRTVITRSLWRPVCLDAALCWVCMARVDAGFITSLADCLKGKSPRN